MSAKQLTDEKIKPGIGILVKNQGANFGEAEKYVNFYLRVPSLVNPRLHWTTGTLTFTENEVDYFFTKPYAKCPFTENPDLNLGLGDVVEGWFSGGYKYLARISYKGICRTVLLSQKLIKAGIKRNKANPEDSTKPSLLTRIFT